MGRKEDNVLLIAMSTLPVSVEKMKPNLYGAEINGNSEYFTGISQLEPGTKYYLRLLGLKKQKIRRIVILSTVDTSRKPCGVYRGEEVTAVSFYRKRILEYIRREAEPAFDLNGASYDIAPLPSEVRYTDEELEDLFRVIDDIDRPETADQDVYFWRAVEEISGDEPGKKINLYMDMQGGLRKVNAQMDAVVSLLKARRVRVKQRIATDYNREDAKKNPQPIRDVDQWFRTYDLVAAMTVFTNYGRGQELREYLGDSELTGAIVKASEAISLCDIGRFDEAIQELNTIVNRDRSGVPKTQADVVMEDIRQSFEELWHDDLHYVRQIRWCLKNRFVQQALTILESKMPYEYVVNGLRYYCGTGDDKEEILRKFEQLYEEADRIQRYRFRDINHYFIKDYRDSGIPRKTLLPEQENRISQSIRDYNKLSGKRNAMNHAASRYPAGGFHHYMAGRHSGDALWQAEDRDSEEQIIGMIEEYLKDFEKLAREAEQTGRLGEVVDLQ